MSVQSMLQSIQSIIVGLKNNPVSRFSYTQRAFDEDIVKGVEVFDRDAEQNIPLASKTDYNYTVLDKGVRTQGASIPRNGWNHFIGRSSYNLNKLIQKVLEFFTLHMSSLAHNANAYDTDAQYLNGDVCYIVDLMNAKSVYSLYQRISTSPETISGIPVTNGLHWALLPEKSLVEEAASRVQGDTDTLNAANTFTVEKVTDAQLATQTWLAAVKLKDDLPSTDLNTSINYLCRVIADTDYSNNGVWQAVAGWVDEPEWTFFSDNADWVSDGELQDAISAHNSNTSAHQGMQITVPSSTSTNGTIDTAARTDSLPDIFNWLRQKINWIINYLSTNVGVVSWNCPIPATIGWYRIAASAMGIERNHGQFLLRDPRTGQHTATIFHAGTQYGNSAGTELIQLSRSSYNTGGITQIRIVYNTTYADNYAYLEVYNATATATTLTVEPLNVVGWGTRYTATAAGEVPSGYASLAITLGRRGIVAQTVNVAAKSGIVAPTTSPSAAQQTAVATEGQLAASLGSQVYTASSGLPASASLGNVAFVGTGNIKTLYVWI